MLTHIVLIKFKADSQTAIPKIARQLREMEGKIPELLSIEVGVNAIPSARAYDIALTARFESEAALEAYQKHPVHVKVLEALAPFREASVVVDY